MNCVFWTLLYWRYWNSDLFQDNYYIKQICRIYTSLDILYGKSNWNDNGCFIFFWQALLKKFTKDDDEDSDYGFSFGNLFRCICCPKPKPNTEENKFALVLEKLENLEKAIKRETIDNAQEEVEGRESTTDEGVIVTFENVKEDSGDSLRKRKEGLPDSNSKEENREINGFRKLFSVLIMFPVLSWLFTW